MKRRLQRMYNIDHESRRYTDVWDLISDFKERTLDEASEHIDIPWEVDSVDFLSSNTVIITVVTNDDPRPFISSDPIESDTVSL